MMVNFQPDDGGAIWIQGMADYARRTNDGGHTDLVSITAMVKEGIDPRQFAYRCVDEVCDAPVFPAIPDKVKPGRTKSPSPYFRAGRTRPHIKGCRRVSIAERIAMATPDTKTTNPGAAHEETGLAPVRFVETPPTCQSGKDSDEARDGELHRDEQDGRRGWQGGVKSSEATSRTMERFAEAYENPPRLYAQMPIKIKRCPASNFAETFLPPKEGVRRFLNSNIRHIYRGTYDRKEPWPTGTSIYFEDKANGSPISVWVPKDLEPKSVLDQLLEQAEKAKGRHDAVIYVVGTFIVRSTSKSKKYAIELTSPYQCWIHIPIP